MSYGFIGDIIEIAPIYIRIWKGICCPATRNYDAPQGGAGFFYMCGVRQDITDVLESRSKIAF